MVGRSAQPRRRREGGTIPPAVVAKARTRAGSIASVQGRIQEATAHHTAALRLYKEAGDDWGIAYALQGLGVQAVLETEYERATTLYEEALARFEAIGDAWGIGGTLMNLGCLVGDAGEAERGERLLTREPGARCASRGTRTASPAPS